MTRLNQYHHDNNAEPQDDWPESWKILQDNMGLFVRLAKKAIMYDKKFFNDAIQQMWVEAVFLEDRRDRNGSTKSLKDYMTMEMPDRLRFHHQDWESVIHPPANPRDIERREAYTPMTKAAAERILDKENGRQPFVSFDEEQM